MNPDGETTGRLLFPNKWIATALVLFVLALTLAFTLFTIWEHLQLTSTQGDAGYPFGTEEAGADYATKEIYLERGLWIIAIGAALSAAMLFGLLRRKPVVTWVAWLLSILLFFLLMARASA